MKKIAVNDIMSEFKSRQNLLSNKDVPPTKKAKTETRKGVRKTPTDPYELYKKKLDAGNLKAFSTLDLMYFFKDVANENGCRYIISNVAKDRRMFKMLLERGMSVEEILVMIEFVFTSGQKYLDTETLHPGIFLTKWCTTLLRDSKLWLDDKFDPNATKFKQSKATSKSEFMKGREWQGSNSDEDIAIGEWGL